MPAIRLDEELSKLTTLFIDLDYLVTDSCIGHGDDGTKRRMYFSFSEPKDEDERISFWSLLTRKIMSRGMKIEKTRNGEFKLFFDYISNSSRDAAIKRMEGSMIKYLQETVDGR